MKTRVLFVERKRSHFVSIERVFRQIAKGLPADEFETDFQQVPYSNDIVSVVKNFLFFRRIDADIYHVTGHIHYIALFLPNARTVLTIHDLGFLHTRKGLRRYFLKKLLLDWPLRRLKWITVVSDFTKQEILKHGEVDEKKIHVIENPLGAHLVAREKSAFRSECPVILQIGTMENKNIPNLLLAVNGINCILRIIGPLDDNLEKLIIESNVTVENVSDLDDDAMASEYHNADIVAFCSTYEGFGLPVIESQAMRTAVVTSDISPLREVAGNGAMLVDPADVASIRNGIVTLINDQRLREELIEKGRENARRFDAGGVSSKFAELYREMIETDKKSATE